MAGDKVLFLIRIGFIFLGFIFLGIGIGIWRYRVKKGEMCIQQVQAIVVDIICEHSKDSMDHSYRESWYPVYEYIVKNKKIRERSHVGGKKNDYYIGETVLLQVNPENVRQFYNPKDQAMLIACIFGVVGGILLLAGAVVWILEK